MAFVITRTPYRVSFFGGGSDYPEWYLEHGGAVLSSSINKYCFITVRHLPRIGGIVHRVVWRHVENVETLHDILHPAVREGMKFLNFDDSTGYEIQYQGDLPARAGMGSSSTFAVGLLHALRAARGEKPTAHNLATEAIHLERVLLKDSVGSQDQMAAAYGGLNFIEFKTSGEIAVKPIEIEKSRLETLENHLLLLFTGRQRTASSVAQSVIQNLGSHKQQVTRMQQMATEGVDIIRAGDMKAFGSLMHEAWTLKRGISNKVSTEFIDRIYALARENGAWGGKLLGAGQAGFMCFAVPPEKREQLTTALHDLGTIMPFSLDRTGTQVVYSADATAGR